MRIGNGTDLAMKNIELNVIWLDEKGATQQTRRIYKGPLAGGKADQLQLDLEISNVSELSNRVKVQVMAAQLAQ